MSFPLVQSTHGEQAFGVTVTPTLSASPTAGNILFAAISFPDSRTLTTPSGWTSIDNLANGSRGDHLAVLWHLVAGGDGTAWAFTMDSNDAMGSTLVEVSGLSTVAPVDKHGITSISDTNTFTSGSLTPTAAGDWGLAFLGTSAGSSGSQSVSSVTTGWTNNVNSIPSFHGCFEASANAALGAGALTMTFTMAAVFDSAILSLLLLTPSGGGGGSRGLFMAPPVSGVGIGGSFFRDPLQGAPR